MTNEAQLGSTLAYPVIFRAFRPHAQRAGPVCSSHSRARRAFGPLVPACKSCMGSWGARPGRVLLVVVELLLTVAFQDVPLS